MPLGRPKTLVDLAYREKYPPQLVEEKDPDLAWVDEEIRKCQEGSPNYWYQPELQPDMAEQRRDRLTRLQRVRARLLGEEP